MKRTPLKRRRISTFKCRRCGVEVTRRQIGAGFCRPCGYAQGAEAAERAADARRGTAHPCVVCGAATSSGSKFCSNACRDVAYRRISNCVVCGVEFVQWTTFQRQTCTAKCYSKLAAKRKVGHLNPAYKNGAGPAQRAWRASAESVCRQCGQRGPCHVHHVIYEQHVRRAGGDVYDPRNGLSLCTRCHFRHHHAIDARISADILRPENREFAAELLGDAAELYFARYYAAEGEDDPIGIALDQAARGPCDEVSP